MRRCLAYVLRVIVLCTYFAVPAVTETSLHTVEDEQAECLHYVNRSNDLYTELFTTRHYRKELSPIYTKRSMVSENGTERRFSKFNVNVTMGYARIMLVIEAEQLFNTVAHFIMSWTDVRLKWDPEKYDGIEEIFVHRDFVWIPENSVNDAQTVTNVHPEYISTVKIRCDGTVSYDHSFYAQTACRVNVATFPFDRQVCGINFIVYSYNHTLVAMTGKIRDFDFKTYSSNGEWLVENITVENRRVGFPDAQFDILIFGFHIKRNPHYYIYVIVVPCFILTCLSIIGMFWTPNVKEDQIGKLSIGLTSLMSMTVLLDMVSQQIPKTVTFPLLGVNVIICVVIIGVASVVLVTFTTRVEPEKKKRHWSFMDKLRWQIFSLHFGLLLLFELLNIANFIALMGHWI